jgi:N,N'-diacetylchitobiose phosphorylase
VRIRVDNPERVEKGVKSITLNGKMIEGNTIPFKGMEEVNEVLVVMG